jgi:hypothetical protein
MFIILKCVGVFPMVKMRRKAMYLEGYNFTMMRMFEFEKLMQKSVRFSREKGVFTRHSSIQ